MTLSSWHVCSLYSISPPDQFRLDEAIRWDLAARKDPREVFSDPHTRYYGIAVKERTLPKTTRGSETSGSKTGLTRRVPEVVGMRDAG